MKLTFIAYKPESDCISMGCVVEHYQSDFKIVQCENLNQLAAEIVKIREYKCDEQELPYETHILVDGQPTSELTGNFDEQLQEKVEEAQARRNAELEIENARALEQAKTAAQAVQEQQRQKDLENFFALGKKLGLEIPTPHVGNVS